MIPQAFKDSYTHETDVIDIMLEVDFQMRISWRISEKITRTRHTMTHKTYLANMRRMIEALAKLSHLTGLLHDRFLLPY